MLALFKSAFGTEMPSSLWQWKYAKGKGYGCWEDGKLIAHCGLFPRAIFVSGQVCVAWQLGDLMVSANSRGGNLSRIRSPFSCVVGAVLKDVFNDKNPNALAFGFPSDRAMRLGEKLGLFAAIDNWYEIELDPFTSSQFMPRVREVSLLNQHVQNQINKSWSKMRPELKQHLVGERNPDYWMWRYAHHPIYTYRVFEVKHAWWPVTLAYLVMREISPGRWLWVDFVGSLSRFSTAALGAVVAARQLDGQTVFTFGSEAVAKLFANISHSKQQTEIRIMGNPASEISFLQRYSQKWWLMAGDTDYL
jgi:hypothetical protein